MNDTILKLIEIILVLNAGQTPAMGVGYTKMKALITGPYSRLRKSSSYQVM